MAMRLNVDFENQNLPTAQTPHDKLLALPNLAHWWSAEEDDITVVTDKVKSFTDKVTQDANYAWSQATATKRAALTAAGMSLESTATFDEAAPNFYALTTDPVLTGTHSLVVIYKPASPMLDLSRNMIGNFTDGSSRYGIWQRTSGDNAYCLLGDGAINFNMLADANNCTILAKNATTFRVRHNGVTSSAVSHNNTTGAGGLLLGVGTLAEASPFRGEVADILFFSTDIADGGAEMDALAAYALEMYDVTA